MVFGYISYFGHPKSKSGYADLFHSIGKLMLGNVKKVRSKVIANSARKKFKKCPGIV